MFILQAVSKVLMGLNVGIYRDIYYNDLPPDTRYPPQQLKKLVNANKTRLLPKEANLFVQKIRIKPCHQITLHGLVTHLVIGEGSLVVLKD